MPLSQVSSCLSDPIITVLGVLLPHLAGTVAEKAELAGRRLCIWARARAEQASCPACGRVAVTVTAEIDNSQTERTEEIYDPAKTVADCFKFRSRIGMDVALDVAAHEVSRGQRAIEPRYDPAGNGPTLEPGRDRR